MDIKNFLLWFIFFGTFHLPNSKQYEEPLKISALKTNYENFHKANENGSKYRFQQKNNIVEQPLRIGSFNVQTLSAKKFRNTDIMTIVEKVILRYDLILILEIMLSYNDRYNMQKLLTVINRLAPEGQVYNMTLSPKLSEDTTELCGIFYRTDKLNIMRMGVYPDLEKSFYRKPYVVQFTTSNLRDMNNFVVVGHHVKPTQAAQEINALADVYDFIKREHKIPNVLFMGDFNADCTYVKEEDWKNISLWTREEFTWPIATHVDTTTNYKSCALDRFVYAGENMNDGIIMSSAKVFNFQEAFGLSVEQTKKVSDHWPIEIKIRGRMSTTAEKYLTTSVCFTMSDSRSLNLTSASTIASKAKTAGFSVSSNVENLVVLQHKTNEEKLMVQSVKNLRNYFPEFITEEQIQGAMYKINHGSLQDESSNVDVGITPTFWITAEQKRTTSTITICKKSTVN